MAKPISLRLDEPAIGPGGPPRENWEVALADESAALRDYGQVKRAYLGA